MLSRTAEIAHGLEVSMMMFSCAGRVDVQPGDEVI